MVAGDSGGALVAEVESGPYFLLPQPSLTAWTRSGGVEGPLGAPVSDFYGTESGLRQNFVGGSIILSADGIELQVAP